MVLSEFPRHEARSKITIWRPRCAGEYRSRQPYIFPGTVRETDDKLSGDKYGCNVYTRRPIAGLVKIICPKCGVGRTVVRITRKYTRADRLFICACETRMTEAGVEPTKTTEKNSDDEL